MLFATRLLEMAKEQEIETADISVTNENENKGTEDGNESTFKCFHEATLLLIEEYRLQENNITSGKMTHKKVWNNIASVLLTKGYCVNGSQCLSKYNGMKRTYKSIKDHNSKSGNNPRTWSYMSIMESLLGERPFISPPAIASSNAICSDNESSSSSNACNSIDLNLHTNPRKRKIKENTLKISESIIQSRELAEKNRDERHKENMEYRKEMLRVMHKLLDKL